ncbi:MAG: glycosyl transferase [Paracoccaceae bacterium]|nr:glycosyl transferase [Paracoccaceae bacterium]
MPQPRIVMCMKWGTLFPADYVNVLFNACRQHITGPFRFVCLTDDALGFTPGIEAFPLPDVGLSPEDWYAKGVWPKLGIYRADLHGLTGRCLFIDLDTVIVGNLDPFFEYSKGFVSLDMGEAWRPGPSTAPPEAGTSTFAFDLGQETQILQSFLADPKGVMARFHNEQDYVGATARSMDFWPRDWVVSFKRHLRQPIGLDLFLPPKRPPQGTRLVAFHGTPRPLALLPARAGFWDRFPHMGHGQVKWMVDYWVENGGRVPPFVTALQA